MDGVELREMVVSEIGAIVASVATKVGAPEPEPEPEAEHGAEAADDAVAAGGGKAAILSIRRASSTPLSPPPEDTLTYIDKERKLTVFAYREKDHALAREAQIVAGLDEANRQREARQPVIEAQLAAIEESALTGKALRHARDKLAGEARQNAQALKFEDPEFPADARSLFRDPDLPWYGHVPVETLGPWRRPDDIGNTPNEAPSLFEDGIESGDVIQGALGDCWFLGAMSSLSTRPELLESIFVTGHRTPEEQAHCAKYGVYVLKFYKWVEEDERSDIFVVIDDRIPCNQLGKPLYARSASEDEMWVMLLEKAYAKLHRNYENLKTGFVDYALRDLTGGNTQQHKWVRPETAPELQKEADELWSRLTVLMAEGCLIGCSSSTKKGERREVDSEGYGILKGHAYSLIDVQCLTTGATGGAPGVEHRLLRVRNPWGQREWEGTWADNAPEWGNGVLAAMNAQLEDAHAMKRASDAAKGAAASQQPFKPFEFGNDGTFWMTVEDFTKQFNTLYVLRDLPPDWEGQQINGAWKNPSCWSPSAAWVDPPAEGMTAGGSPMEKTFLLNPQQQLTVTQPMTRCLLLLEQPDLRMAYEGKVDPFSSEPPPPMFPNALGLMVVRVPSDSEFPLSAMPPKDQIVAVSRAWAMQREVSLEVELTLVEGAESATFAVIPSLFTPGVATRFRLHVWTQGCKPALVAGAGGAVLEQGNTDLGFDAEHQMLDPCEVDEETGAAEKASASTLRDVSEELSRLRDVVTEQHKVLEGQRELLERLLAVTPVAAMVAPASSIAPPHGTPPRVDAVLPVAPASPRPVKGDTLYQRYLETCLDLGDDSKPNENVAATLMAVPGGAESATQLDFSLHLVGDRGMVALSRVLSSCSGLVSLVLTGNGIRDEAALTVRRSPPYDCTLRCTTLPARYHELSINFVCVRAWACARVCGITAGGGTAWAAAASPREDHPL